MLPVSSANIDILPLWPATWWSNILYLHSEAAAKCICSVSHCLTSVTLVECHYLAALISSRIWQYFEQFCRLEMLRQSEKIRWDLIFWDWYFSGYRVNNGLSGTIILSEPLQNTLDAVLLFVSVVQSLHFVSTRWIDQLVQLFNAQFAVVVLVQQFKGPYELLLVYCWSAYDWFDAHINFWVGVACLTRDRPIKYSRKLILSL